MSRKRNDPVRRMRTRGYISRFVFRVCTLCMIGLRIGGAGEPPKLRRRPRSNGRRGRRSAAGGVHVAATPTAAAGRRGAGGRWPVAQPHA